jgi:hypothetical protein
MALNFGGNGFSLWDSANILGFHATGWLVLSSCSLMDVVERGSVSFVGKVGKSRRARKFPNDVQRCPAKPRSQAQSKLQANGEA